MLNSVRIENILFLDIETVPQEPSLDQLSPLMQNLWDKKSKHFRNPDQSAEDVYERAGIYSEFGRIICISAGYITGKNPFSFRLKSFYGDNETDLLSEFSTMLTKFTASNKEAQLCAHNGKEFDFPFLSRRMIINRLKMPEILDNAGKKPWDIKVLDTMDLWKFGDYKNYTSLDLLTSILGIDSPKDDIDGSMVAGIYYEEKNLRRIVQYCEKDVVAIAQVLLRFMGLSSIPHDKIESVTVLQ